ncbi:MAG: S-adenosylmethionine decarboxylase [Deltaproteobacteria bacterium]|nr:S-adenosylmethionine decarboxylase [Deltaproteobacteria bacterium]MCB9787561.1 S-adenosylmethionine decarboxylase [Deltaproteobacteria bacterium]
MDIRSRHIVADVWLGEPADDALVAGLLARAREHLSVLGELVHRFEPHGITALLVLSESHLSLHTYPEHAFVSLDLYLCNPAAEPHAILDALLAPITVRHQVRRLLWRGVPDP